MQRTTTICLTAALCLVTDAFSLGDLRNLRHSLVEGDAAAQTDFLTRNDTFDILDIEGRATAYAGKVMIVDMGSCSNPLPESKFYKGLMVNTYGYTAATSCVDYTSYRLGSDSEKTSSTWGCSTPQVGTAYHTWEWLQFPDGKDIRESALEIEFRAWNALPQMYFPLLSPSDAKIGGNLAYMIWIKPNKALLGNSDAYSYHGDCAFNRGPVAASCGIVDIYNKLMSWNISIASLIRNIESDLTIDALSGYTYNGFDRFAVGGSHSSSHTYSTVNQHTLKPTSQGNAGDNLCGWYLRATEDRDILMTKLRTVMSWL